VGCAKLLLLTLYLLNICYNHTNLKSQQYTQLFVFLMCVTEQEVPECNENITSVHHVKKWCRELGNGQTDVHDDDCTGY
jgi:hypothetical protein